jgi:hypothetical protein
MTMIVFVRTPPLDGWLSALGDDRGKVRILAPARDIRELKK